MAMLKFKIKKILILWICIVAITLTAGVVYALNTLDTGFQLISNVDHPGTPATTINMTTAGCVECRVLERTASQDIFVPTKTCNEWNAFRANKPLGVSDIACGPPPFVCGDNFTDPRDGQIYSTVSIGAKCWMAKNLNYGTRIKGYKDNVTIYNQTNDSLVEKYCWNDLDANCATYGGYYQWHEAVQLPRSCDLTDCSASINAYPWRGVCPVGWHVPSDVENAGSPALNNDWYAAENALSPGTCAPDRGDGSFDCGNAGQKMKVGGSSGLEIKVDGSLTENASEADYIDMNVDVHLWSSSSLTNSNDPDLRAWGRDIDQGNNGIKRKAKEKSRGFNVRCVKD